MQIQNEIELSETRPTQIETALTQNTKKYSHLRLMIIKNYLIYRRQIGMTSFLLASPIMICFMIIFWQALVDQLSNFLVINPPVVPMIEQFFIIFKSRIPKCRGPSDCVSVGYFVLGPVEEWIPRVMQRVADRNHLVYEKDVKLLSAANDPVDVSEYFNANMNKTQIAVVFCTDRWNLTNFGLPAIPCRFERLDQQMVFYTIFYNYSLLYKVPYLSDMRQSYPKDAIASKLKSSLDNAILYEFSKTKNKPKDDYINVYTQEYPKIPNRFVEGIDVAGNYGAFYFFAPYLLCFLMTINELLQEKGKKLRQGLAVMGLSHFTYWTSWIITIIVQVIALTIIMIISGNMMGFDLFTKTPTPILFVLFTTFGFAVQMLAFFIAVMCPDVKNGYTIAYGFILTAIIMQMFFTQSVLTVLFYRSDRSQWIKITRVILSFYPAFKYSMIYSDISQKACKHYSLEESRWVEGEGFGYKDLFQDQTGTFTLENQNKYESPSAMENYLHLCLCCLFYIILTWYFDHVLASNRGRSDSMIFFLKYPIQWFRQMLTRRNAHVFHGELQPIDYDDMTNSNSSEQEKARVISNYANRSEVGGLRLVGLTKTYRKYPFGIESMDDVHALKEVFFEVERGELLALLGHNGAGKTTLIGVLTGMFEPCSGEANICNYDIKTQMDQIRKIMGVCPQFDILWPCLTAAEHLRMYASIKGVLDIEKEVDDRLRDVDLLHVKNAQICTFSGGMKRRVSLAISAIGNPKVIILDEPTTGMDPKARRQVWQMIKNLKNDKVVLLTTHAMEEADALADRIAVMAEGTLRCIGTSLYLKNNFSDGYRLNLVCEQDNKEQAIKSIKDILPDARLQDSSGGSLVFSISMSLVHKLQPFFEMIENDLTNPLKELIKDWGLSHATLEEVFMKVTKKQD